MAANGIEGKKSNLVAYWDEHGEYITYRVGQVIPFSEKCLRRAYYRISKIEAPNRCSDLAGWDDGRHYDLTFDHLESI